MKKTSKKILLVFIVLPLFFLSLSSVNEVISIPSNGINVLTIIHPEVDENQFSGVVSLLLSYGCTVTYTGFVSSITVHTKTISRDLLVSEVDVNDYDVFFMAGGWAASRISEGPNSAEAFTLVQQAVNASVLMTSICGGAHLFAAANIINGIRITAYDGLEAYIESMGGIYDSSTLVHSGNFVTAQHHYHISLAEKIADVLGIYEQTSPTCISMNVVKLNDTCFNITVETADESPVKNVLIPIYEIYEDNSTSYLYSEELDETSTDYTFSGVISFSQAGNYSLGVYVIDCYGNLYLETDITELNIPEIITETPTNTTNSTILISLICLVCLVGTTIVRRRILD